jgi:hypothetical protein
VLWWWQALHAKHDALSKGLEKKEAAVEKKRENVLMDLSKTQEVLASTEDRPRAAMAELQHSEAEPHAKSSVSPRTPGLEMCTPDMPHGYRVYR